MHFLEVASQLRERGVISDVLALAGRPGVMASRLEAIGGSVIVQRIAPSLPASFSRALAGNRYSAVHSHVATASGLFLSIAKVRGVASRVAQFHSDGDGRETNVRRTVQRMVLRKAMHWSATSCFGVSSQSLDFHFGNDWRQDARCSVIANPIDLSRLRRESKVPIRAELGLEASVPLAVHVGRTAPEKNRIRLPRLMAADPTSQVHLLIIGEISSTEQKTLEELAKSLRIQKRIHILGPREDAPQIIGEAQVLLLPSIREGQPGVVLEAVAQGVPVLATRLPGLTELKSEFPHEIHLLEIADSDEIWGKSIVRLARQEPRLTRSQAESLVGESPHALSIVAERYFCAYSMETA